MRAKPQFCGNITNCVSRDSEAGAKQLGDERVLAYGRSGMFRKQRARLRILGIESSCDETAAAVVADGREILSSVVASQIDVHRKYGGVVPELASREHLRQIVPVVREAVAQAGCGLRMWTQLA